MASAMSADASKRAPKKRITDDEWLSFKSTIGKLYLDEGKDVKEVRDTMKRDYGFDAHEKAYKRKFEEWGMTKNVPKDEGLFMVKKRERRREEGKDTIFWRRRRAEGPLQLVPDDKVDRIADRYSHDLNTLPDSPVTTPKNIEYGTPHQTPSTHPGLAHHPRSVPNGGAVNPTSVPVNAYVDLNTGAEWPFPPIPAISPATQARLGQPTLAETLIQQYHNHHHHQHHPHSHHQVQPQTHSQGEDHPMVGHSNHAAPTSMPWNPWGNQYF